MRAGEGPEGLSACVLELPASMCHKDQPEATVMKKQLKIWASGQRPARRRARPRPRGCLPLGRRGPCGQMFPGYVRWPFMWEVLLPETQTPGLS